MGDLLGFSTLHNKEQKYGITSGAVKFYVKGKGSAAIGLFNNDDKCEYRIIIGNEHSWIDSDEKVNTIGMMSGHTYKPFWISWYGNKIRIGERDNPKPFLEKDVFLKTFISYISFSSSDGCHINWKFRLLPKMKEHMYKKISDGELKWVKIEGNSLPDNALIGGYEHEVLYIMRAMHEEALTPGKFVPSKKAGYVAWGYDSHKKNAEMEVLCGYDGIWVESQYDDIPRGAVAGGYSEVNHETLYVGRATYDGYILPGKVQPSHRVCYMAYKGQTILCGFDGVWVPTEGDRIPDGALVGGYTEYHETMFVGRALHNEVVIPGKIAPSHKVCYIPYNGKEIAKANYEILVNLHFSNEE